MKLYNTVWEYLKDAKASDIICIEFKDFTLTNGKVSELRKPNTNRLIQINENKNIVYRPFRSGNEITLSNMDARILHISREEYEQLPEYISRKKKNTVLYSELLTPYTLAANCTDLTDLNDGIRDINEAIDRLKRINIKPPHHFFVRLKALNQKKARMEKGIYLIGINGKFDLHYYADTPKKAEKLGIRLVMESLSIEYYNVTKEPEVTAVKQNDTHYRFTVWVKDNPPYETIFEFKVRKVIYYPF